MNKEYKTINELIEETKAGIKRVKSTCEDLKIIIENKKDTYINHERMLDENELILSMYGRQLQMLNDIKDMLKNTKPKEEELFSEYLERIIGDDL